MTLELLLPHFDELIRTPEDVQRLNEAILQLAVQGKLVPQDPGDEPAGELLKRMEIEKERLIASKVIGSSGRDVVLDQTQAQFTLPNRWSWAAVADVGYIERGVSFPASAKETTLIDGHIACLRTTNIQANVDWQDLIFIPRDYVTGEAKLVYRNDIMISMANSFELVGKVSYVNDLPMEATFGGFIAAFRSIGGMYARFVFLVMKSSFMQEMFRRSSSQTTNIANISLGRIYPLPFPVPPFAEQHRIVAKVDELFAQTRALEAKLRQAQADIVTANRAALHRLHTAQDDGQFQAAWRTLRDHFDLLYDDPRNVAELRQAILDLAVRGKLVPQEAEDEPAGELLRLLHSPKNREGSGWASMTFDEPLTGPAPALSSKIPTNWIWTKAETLCETIVDCPHSTPKFVPQGIVCLDTNGFKDSSLIQQKIRYVSTETYLDRTKRLVPRPGDIVFAREGSVGESVIIPEGMQCCLGQRVMLFRPSRVILPAYFRLALSAPSALSRLLSMHKGMGAKHINVADMRTVMIPLPPLAEQHRIVAKVDQLMQLCDALQAGLVQAEVQRRSLTAAVLSGICIEAANLAV